MLEARLHQLAANQSELAATASHASMAVERIDTQLRAIVERADASPAMTERNAALREAAIAASRARRGRGFHPPRRTDAVSAADSEAARHRRARSAARHDRRGREPRRRRAARRSITARVALSRKPSRASTPVIIRPTALPPSHTLEDVRARGAALSGGSANGVLVARLTTRNFTSTFST